MDEEIARRVVRSRRTEDSQGLVGFENSWTEIVDDKGDRLVRTDRETRSLKSTLV